MLRGGVGRLGRACGDAPQSVPLPATPGHERLPAPQVKLKANPNNAPITSLVDYDGFCGGAPTRITLQSSSGRDRNEIVPRSDLPHHDAPWRPKWRASDVLAVPKPKKPKVVTDVTDLMPPEPFARLSVTECERRFGRPHAA